MIQVLQHALKTATARFAQRWPGLAQTFEQRVLLPLLGMSGSAQAAWVDATLRRDGRVLEVGTRRMLTQASYARRPALVVIGVDPSPSALRVQQARLRAQGITNIHLVCARPHLLPFTHDQFDQLVTLNLFQRVPHSMAVVDDLLRVAVDGAALVGTAIVEIDDDPRALLQRLLRATTHIYAVRPEALHELLGTTWSKLTGQRTGAVYAFHRPQLDPASGDVLPPDTQPLGTRS